MGTSDLERLTQIVAERAAAMGLYARQWVDAATAEDVVQEALTALLGERSTPANPVAWMYRAVRNGAIDAARASTRRRWRERAVAAERARWFDSRVDALVDAQIAEQALKQLSAEHREIVVLRIWAQLGFSEIADLMQIGVSTAHDRYGSALKQLRNALEKSCKNKRD